MRSHTILLEVKKKGLSPKSVLTRERAVCCLQGLLESLVSTSQQREPEETSPLHS